jgi:hypothetical protein
MNARADPLALPPVPPPAPATHRWRDGVIAAMFVAMLALPGLVLPGLAWMGIELPGMETLKTHPTLELENRRASSWPSFPLSRQFTADFERAFADRFFARSLLLFAHHATLVDFFAVSPTPNVMLGRDGWLYFLGEDGKSLERNYRGTIPIADAEIAAVAAELRRRAQFLAAHGISYVVTIVPDKFSIYPEYLPGWAAKSALPTPLERAAAALTAQGDLRFVDLRAPLRAAKARERVYFMTDSHWNLAGASVGYDAIMREVQRALGQTRLPAVVPPPRPPYVPGVDVYSGDLARSVGLLWHLKEPDFVSLGKVFADTTSRCAKRIDAGIDEGFEIYACDRPGLPRAVVLRDSMAIPLLPLLSENFSRVVYVSSRRLDPALILREKPDVVIEEMVERSLLAPAASPMAN